MNATSYINISLEIFCSVLSVFIIIHLCLDDTKNTKLNRLFIITMICNIVNLLSDAACWAVMGNTAGYTVVANHVGTFLVYIFNYITPAIFASYVTAYISTKTKVSKKYTYAIYGLASLGVAAIIFSQFTDLIYYIDANNIYHRAEGSKYVFLSQTICVFILGAMVVQYGKRIGKRDVILISSYIILPLLGTALQVSSYGIAGTNIGSALSVFIIYFGIQSEQSKLLKQQELELTESRVAIMLSQIQPHFLYNSMTGIMNLCTTDVNMAKQALAHLSKYLRGNMNSLSNKMPIPFDEELEHVKIYLSLEKMRFGERLIVEYDITFTGFMLPALTLQPIVENAVRHGVTKKDNGGTVTIATAKTAEAFVITVTDDGAGFDTKTPKADGTNHIGIENARNRIALMCGGTLEITSVPCVGTTAIITIPKGGKKHEYYSG